MAVPDNRNNSSQWITSSRIFPLDLKIWRQCPLSPYRFCASRRAR